MDGKNRKCAVLNGFLFFLLLLGCSDVNAGRNTGSNNRHRTPSNSGGGHVTKPTYNYGNSAGNSHTELTKLSYPNQNSQPNHGIGSSGNQNAPPIGWNVPKNQGPPPGYSATNPVGGAKTNMHEPPPVYNSNNQAIPGSNVHQPITATNTHGVQSGYPQQQGGASYYPAGHPPAGATYPAGQPPAGASYYPAGHPPAGASYYPAGHPPAGASYYPAGQMPAGASYYAGGHSPAGAGYYPAGQMPAGATYYPAGQIPAGATYLPSPPQSSSSGLGFGSGLAAGAIGGAILGHALTPQTQVVQQVPASGVSSGHDDKVIIINNGPPGSVQTTQTASGTTVITTGGQPVQQPTDPNGVAPTQQQTGTNVVPPAAVAGGAGAAAIATAPLAPFGVPTPDQNTTAPATPLAPEQPPPGGIVCYPIRVNETDPADSTKMLEVEKVACFPAPPPPPPEALGSAPNPANASGTVPLAPMNPVPNQPSQQMQTEIKTNAGNTAAGIKFNFLLSGILLGLVMINKFTI